MRLRRDSRPNSAQPPKNSSLTSPVVAQPNLPNRTMSVSVRSPAGQSLSQQHPPQEPLHAQRSHSGSLSQAYSANRQRPPINPELLRLQNPEWAGDGEGGREGGREGDGEGGREGDGEGGREGDGEGVC